MEDEFKFRTLKNDVKDLPEELSKPLLWLIEEIERLTDKINELNINPPKILVTSCECPWCKKG